jgi:hypothetical protein
METDISILRKSGHFYFALTRFALESTESLTHLPIYGLTETWPASRVRIEIWGQKYRSLLFLALLAVEFQCEDIFLAVVEVRNRARG